MARLMHTLYTISAPHYSHKNPISSPANFSNSPQPFSSNHLHLRLHLNHIPFSITSYSLSRDCRILFTCSSPALVSSSSPCSPLLLLTTSPLLSKELGLDEPTNNAKTSTVRAPALGAPLPSLQSLLPFYLFWTSVVDPHKRVTREERRRPSEEETRNQQSQTNV